MTKLIDEYIWGSFSIISLGYIFYVFTGKLRLTWNISTAILTQIKTLKRHKNDLVTDYGRSAKSVAKFFLNPRPCKELGWCNLPMTLSIMAARRWEDRAKILRSLWDVLCATFDKQKTVRSGHRAMKSRKVRPVTDFQGNRIFNHITCCHWQEWLYYEWFRSPDDHIWPLELHLNLLKVIRDHWPWLTPYILNL